MKSKPKAKPKRKKRYLVAMCLNLSMDEAKLVVEGLEQREMWGAGNALADRIRKELGLKPDEP